MNIIGYSKIGGEAMSNIEEYIAVIKNIFKKNNFAAPEEEISEVLKKREGKTDEQVIKEINKVVKSKLENGIIDRGEGDFRQNFNYHTHTYRSGHSDYTSDEELVLAAKEMKISMLGFTEHIPNPPLLFPDEDKQMLFSETSEYISSINALKESHPDMKILTGFEVEYDPTRESYLFDMGEKVDYMILGQHFVMSGLNKIDPCTPDYPLKYAEMLCKGISSGLFDIVAHPDFFMRYRDWVEPKTAIDEFMKNAVIASRMICEKARNMGIPIEINLSQASSNRVHSDGNYHYPHPLFWQEAAKVEGLQVIRGIDAHKPKAFKRAGSAEELVTNIEMMVADKIIYYGYDPVVARKNNIKLQAAYEKTKNSLVPFETSVTEILLKKIESRINENPSKSVDQVLNEMMRDCILNAAVKKRKLDEAIENISSSTTLSEEKRLELERTKLASDDVDIVLEKQERLLLDLKKERLDFDKLQNKIVIAKADRNEDLRKLQIYNNDSKIKKYLGYVSTLLISILTILAGAAIIIILRYLNMGD